MPARAVTLLVFNLLAAAASSFAGCKLTDSGPITVTKDNQIIEFVRVRSSSSTPPIAVKGHKNVIIRNVLIEHSYKSAGIQFSGANGLLIQNVSVTLVNPPSTGGPLPSAGAVGINGDSTEGLVVENARTTGGSSGIYLIQCPSAQLRFIQGKNMRGPFPRGQCVQFDKCPRSVLEDFSCVNEIGKNVSFTEDNIRCNPYRHLSLSHCGSLHFLLHASPSLTFAPLFPSPLAPLPPQRLSER
jgi:hypothetical protein